MHRGLINHLDLTVSDLERSVAFYDQILGALGYVRSGEYAGEVPNWTLRLGSLSMSIGLHAARTKATHDRYSPGLHHLAFHATSRNEVDEIHALALSAGAVVLDAPAEYDYTPGYYALFLADPDGLKLEVVYEPRLANGEA
jgi:glyoxylase I family protein